MGYRHMMRTSDAWLEPRLVTSLLKGRYGKHLKKIGDELITVVDCKRYGVLHGIEDEVCRIMRELDSRERIVLMFHADEGTYIEDPLVDSPTFDVSMVVCTADDWKEYRAGSWKECGLHK